MTWKNVIKRQRPDYPDLDGDGDTDEPMVDALETVEQVESVAKIGRIPNKNSRIVREGESTEDSVRDKLLRAIPKNYSVKKLARDVAHVLKNEYGEHNYDGFMKVFHEELDWGN